MGILLYDKNADYSAVSVGHAGLYTSVTDDLLSLFELRRSASKAGNNSAPANPVRASIAGAPTFYDTSMGLTATGQIVFPSQPTNGGETTAAIILKIKNGGSSPDQPFGSSTTTPATNGICYFAHYNRELTFQSTLFDAQELPATYQASVSAALTIGTGEYDGTFQLFVATLKSEDAVKLHWPKRGLVGSVAIASGRYAYFNQAPALAGRRWAARAGGSANFEGSMFAHWDRVLSDDEIATFYAEMKEQFGLIGLEI